MKAEDRIIDIHDIGRWPGISCYIRPTYCSPQELEENVREMCRKFYRYPSMFSRLPWPVTKANIASWVLNLSQRKVSRANAWVENFDDY
jgi:hypothetical protein